VNRPRAVLFDWDNTLVDSWDTIHDALGFCFVAMGREPWSLAEVKARTRLSLREAFPPLFGERWEEAQRHFFARFAAIHLERIRPLPGVTAMLDGLAALGLPLGIVSNKTGAILRFAVEAGAIVAGAGARQQAALLRYGEALGSAFQIADDILDAEATSEQLGKRAGKDAERNKGTFVSIHGLDGAKSLRDGFVGEAIAALGEAGLGGEGDTLREAARFVAARAN